MHRAARAPARRRRSGCRSARAGRAPCGRRPARRAGTAGSRRRRPAGRSSAIASAFGLRSPAALPVAMTRSIGKPWSRRLRSRAASNSRVERRDADEVEAGVVQAMAGLDRAVDRRHRRPELLVEVAAEVGPPLLVEPLDLPAVDRPIGERVALGRAQRRRHAARRRHSRGGSRGGRRRRRGR